MIVKRTSLGMEGMDAIRSLWDAPQKRKPLQIHPRLHRQLQCQERPGKVHGSNPIRNPLLTANAVDRQPSLHVFGRDL